MQIIDGTSGISNATACLLRAVTMNLTHFSEESIRVVYRSIRMLLDTVLAESMHDMEYAGQGSEGDAEAIRQFIARNLADISLGPAMIADSFHISVRQLHRIFEGEHRGVAHEVLEQRIHRCASDLRDPALRHENVSAIALRWGIDDASKFSRQFRSVLGVSPREYRAGHDVV
ncbi:helix-turn-helix domain-containing protein [Streptomyces sp. CA-249302]|uniref:helix-turn-helix domain-containing protein n=1 Tax=Streptomyces sp. CA-249302 TaxID=3240058 RepID=UPI003D909ADF